MTTSERISRRREDRRRAPRPASDEAGDPLSQKAHTQQDCESGGHEREVRHGQRARIALPMQDPGEERLGRADARRPDLSVGWRRRRAALTVEATAWACCGNGLGRSSRVPPAAHWARAAQVRVWWWPGSSSSSAPSRCSRGGTSPATSRRSICSPRPRVRSMAREVQPHVPLVQVRAFVRSSPATVACSSSGSLLLSSRTASLLSDRRGRRTMPSARSDSARAPRWAPAREHARHVPPRAGASAGPELIMSLPVRETALRSPQKEVLGCVVGWPGTDSRC